MYAIELYVKLLLLFHMNEVFDRGLARKMIESLKPLGTIDCRIRGITGYTAALDSGLGDVVKLEKVPITELIARSDHEAIVLTSYTNNPEKFHAYCWLISKQVSGKPIIEVEANSQTVIPLNDEAISLANNISRLLNFKLSEKRTFPVNMWTHGARTYRRILAVEPGDFVLLNGIVIGRAVSSEAILVEENGRIVDAIGVTLKPHGIEKLDRLGFKGLRNSKISSIKVLRERVERRVRINSSRGRGVTIFDHEVADVYEKVDKVEGAITIGDDTTLIISDIFERYGRRILGIMDGDADGLLGFSKLPSNSVLLIVDNDDEAGLQVKDLFRGGGYLDSDFDVVVEKVIELLKPMTKMIIRLR
ncbi:MAG: DUF2117 domain-containing protein [Candidatus Nezhaarchaeota archaeon]|nr:DUF2117 domain-containing protein [Candidatus Nezhaarchaeota archaeon]MCX8141451.1 DUF2117 domain-containing protein [Candidatus Nezhaarchaeota archaeon]MDW8049717.1 DUF2117 domain-containing protein [Nitrososphaerota archaeon]